jgi:hypothetical protein
VGRLADCLASALVSLVTQKQGKYAKINLANLECHSLKIAALQ